MPQVLSDVALPYDFSRAALAKWLDDEKMTVTDFVDACSDRGVPVDVPQNSAYKWRRGAIPRNKVLFEKAFPGIKF